MRLLKMVGQGAVLMGEKAEIHAVVDKCREVVDWDCTEGAYYGREGFIGMLRARDAFCLVESWSIDEDLD